MKSRLSLFAFLVFSVVLVSIVASAQRRPAAEKPIAGDFKITVNTTVAGHSTQSTTMISGARERTETSMNIGAVSYQTINITQCDMRRTIQIKDVGRKYLITPMNSDSSSGNSTAATGASTGRGAERSGVVTITTDTVDTGERKEMFGFTARHLKRTTVMESSPDACQQMNMRMESDGWYINLQYGLSCPANQPPQTAQYSTAGCRDRYIYKTTGAAYAGYPLLETMTIFGAGGSGTTITKEVVDISRQALDASLFDIPAGYTEAKSQEDFNGVVRTAGVGPSGRSSNSVPEQPNGSSAQTTPAERIRVGVVDFNNKTKTSVSTDSLRQQLLAALSANGIDAVPLNAISASEAVTEAQAKKCAYILYTDIATLKAPSAGKKIGGIFGRATGVGSTDTGKNEAKFDFRLVPAGSTSPLAQSSVSAKQDTQDAAVNETIQSEARAVADAIPRQ